MADFNALEGFDWLRGCSLYFDPETGLSKKFPTKKRYLSEMCGMFADDEAYEKLLKSGDRLIYEYHAMNIPQTEGDLSFGCSILHPGKVGEEYFFTKGHFHNILDTSEVYYCTRGHGYLMLESKEGDWRALELQVGQACYVPKNYAHRSINVSPDEPLVTLFVYRADAGHDYGTIETKGFRKLLIEQNGQPATIDNPKWK